MATTNPTINPVTSAVNRVDIPEGEQHSIGVTLRNALIVTRREVRDSFRDWRIMAPIFILTLIFPVLAQGMTGLFTNFFVSNGAAPLIDNFLPLLPMIVGFFPISISLVIALETFVGEKERRSLEPLLSTPLTNAELYIGKTFAAMIPPLMASYAGILIYVGGLVFGAQQWRPELELVIQILALTTAQALVMVTGAVVVSSQTTSTRASNLLASFIIIPVSMLVLLESFIMVTNNRYVLWYIILGLIVADIMLFSMGARIFNREELLGRAIDQINLKWAWKLFREQLFRKSGIAGDTEPIRGVVDWYRRSVFPAVGKLRLPALIVLIGMIGIFLYAYAVPQVRPDLRIPETAMTGAEGAGTLTTFERLFELGVNPETVVAAVLQNVRVLLAATILAIFTFGVMGIFFAITPFAILGFLLGQPFIAVLGLSTFAAAVIPHSLVEIPAILIAAAAAVRQGAIITRPPSGKGVWEAWVQTMGDTVKVWIALVIPLLIIAAIIEVYITPRFVLASLGM